MGCTALKFGPVLIVAGFLTACGGGGSGPAAPPSPPPAPTISTFSASPTSITAGQNTTVSWQVSGETSLELDGASIATTTSSIVETPSVTTTYTLSATNSAGTSQQSVTVNVTPASVIASVQVNPAATPQPIPANFLSIGHDLSEVKVFVGTSSTNMNPIYEQLLKNLLQYGNGPLLIRFLADYSDLTPYDSGYLSALSQLNSDVGAQYFIGVDFEDDNVSTATQEASLLAAGLPGSQLQGLELGNEPDEYESSYSSYLAQYQQFAPALISASGGIKLAAPVWSGANSFMNNLDSFISTQASTISIVTIHHYPGSACNGATEPPDYLLTEAAVDGGNEPLTGPVGISAYLPAAQAAGIPFRIGELNSINCGGQAGVSNTFSSALWGMDVAFAYAQAGVSGINFFTPGSTIMTNPYTPFDFTYTTNSNGTYTYAVRNINPLYYGMLMFEQTAQNHAQLLPVTLTTAANIKAWATIDASQTIRVLLLNKDLTASGLISISLPGYGQATITRLTAPSYSSITGLTLGGQTFDGSTDGTLQGTPISETVQPSGGAYTISVPYVSGVLVTIPQ